MELSEMIIQTGLIFLAAFIGIPAGFWLQHYINKTSLKEQKIQLLQFIHHNLSDNKRLVEQIGRELNPSSITYYPLDLQAWPYIAGQIAILEDWQIADKIQRAYYELAHLERKIDKQFELAYAPVPQNPTYPQMQANVGAMRGELISSGIIPHTITIKNSLQGLLKEIDSKRQGLE